MKISLMIITVSHINDGWIGMLLVSKSGLLVENAVEVVNGVLGCEGRGSFFFFVWRFLAILSRFLSSLSF